MAILLGLLAVGLGALMTIKPQGVLSIVGTVDWAEANMPGGSIGFYKVLGIVVILGGIMGATGMFGKFLIAIITPLFGGAIKGA